MHLWADCLQHLNTHSFCYKSLSHSLKFVGLTPFLFTLIIPTPILTGEQNIGKNSEIVSQTGTPNTADSSSGKQLQAWVLCACLVGPQHLLNQIRNSGEGMHIEMLKSSAILASTGKKIHGIGPIKNKLGHENY